MALAAAFTLLAVPAVLIAEHRGSSPSSAASATSAAPSDVDDSDPSRQKPVFLDNTVVLPAPAVIDIAVPPTTTHRQASGTLTFKNYQNFPLLNPCSTILAPSGAHLTVTNIDNGKQVSCTNTLGVSIPVGADMAIDINLYIQIADLADAPVPVRLEW
jgi:hypothetical protein